MHKICIEYALNMHVFICFVDVITDNIFSMKKR